MLFVKNKEKTRKETIGERISRPWFCNINQWVSDFNALTIKSKDVMDRQTSLDGLDDNEERILLADEYFPRCPVSKEVFEHIWDDEDSEIYYRNAVKILLTELSDPALYKLSKPTLNPNIKYCIVHKSLVLDDWLSTGKATSLGNAILRYQAINKIELVSDLKEAVGYTTHTNTTPDLQTSGTSNMETIEKENEETSMNTEEHDNTFVLLDLSSS